MKSVEQRKRDPFFTEAAYEMSMRVANLVFHGDKCVEDRERIRANSSSEAGARGISFARVRYLIEDVWARYSAGDPLDGMRERVQYMFEDLQRHQKAFPEHSLKLWEPDAYYFVMLLFSWIVFFNVPDKVKTLAAIISRDPDDGWDPFIQVLFATFGVTDFPGAKAELLHPKPYGILYESLPKDRADRQAGIQAYLKSWYKSKSIRGCYWHNRHKAELHPENHLGYWAFETGMLTVLDRLDDSAYRNLNFYPRDLVDYCKAQGWQDELLKYLQAKRAK